MAQRKDRENKPQKQPGSEKEHRELINGILVTLLWFTIDLSFVWPTSHVWAVVLLALFIAIHLLTSPWTLKYKLIYLVLLLLCTAFTVRFIYPNETELHGYLTPANDPLPSGPCPPDTTMQSDSIYFGGNEARIMNRMTIAVVSVPNHPLLEFHFTKKGLAISGEIYTDSGEVASMINNEFWLNPNLTFRSDHPNAHTLIVRDNAGTENLNIDYFNKRAIRFTGKLFLPGVNKFLVITDSSMRIVTKGSASPDTTVIQQCIDGTDSYGDVSVISILQDGRIGFLGPP